MKKFVVCVTRDITEQCTVTVYADDAFAAQELAYEKAQSNEAEWNTTDFTGDMYAQVEDAVQP
jgi:hypothetical protein